MRTGSFFAGDKAAESEVNQSSPSNTEIKNEWNYNSIPHMPLRRGASSSTGNALSLAFFTVLLFPFSKRPFSFLEKNIHNL
jgi:hypothetical protein